MVFPKQAEVLISGILDGNDAEIGIFNVIHLEKQVVGKKSHFLLLQSLVISRVLLLRNRTLTGWGVSNRAS